MEFCKGLSQTLLDLLIAVKKTALTEGNKGDKNLCDWIDFLSSPL